MTLPEITDHDFEREVLASDQPVLVEFWAPWCGPCRQVTPALAAIADERAGTLRVVKVNSDENPLTSTRYRVMGLPTMIVFRDGEPVHELRGSRSKAALDRELDQALAGVPLE